MALAHRYHPHRYHDGLLDAVGVRDGALSHSPHTTRRTLDIHRTAPHCSLPPSIGLLFPAPPFNANCTMSRKSLTAPTLIAVSVQVLPTTTATTDCYIFSSVVHSNSTPTDLYVTLLSPQHTYHTQMPLPAGVTTSDLKDAFRQPGDGHSPYRFQLHEDKAAATAAGHAGADAMLYVRKDRRERRAWLTVPLQHNDGSHHKTDQLLLNLQKLFQRLEEGVAQHEAESAARSADIQHKLALLQQKVRAKQSVEEDMAQCTLLLLNEKRDELARCEKDYLAALSARREARREKARSEREEKRQPPSAAEVLTGADDETNSEGQTTSEDEEAESELSRLDGGVDDATSDSDAAMLENENESDWQLQPREADDLITQSSPSSAARDGPSHRTTSASFTQYEHRVL